MSLTKILSVGELPTAPTRSILARVSDKLRPDGTPPGDYYAESLAEREKALRMSQAARQGHLPGHTVIERQVLLSELDNMAHDPALSAAEIVEVAAVKTLVESGHVPTVSTLPELVRQRGAPEAIKQVVARMGLLVKGLGRSAVGVV